MVASGAPSGEPPGDDDPDKDKKESGGYPIN